jgi:hypothetical protein
MDKMNETDFIPGNARPPVKAEKVPVEFPVIPLPDEQRSILEQPVDPRVARILSKIGEEQKTMAQVIDSRRIIQFPFVGSALGHAIRDADGHWTVVSGPPPEVPLRAAM